MKKMIIGLVLFFSIFCTGFIEANAEEALTPSVDVDILCPVGGVTRILVYNTNGGNEITSDQLSSVPNSNPLPTPVKNGYTFQGWYYDSALTDKVEATNKSSVKYTPSYTADGCVTATTVNLYAKWVTNEFSDTDNFCSVGGTTYNIIYNTNGTYNIHSEAICTTCSATKTKLPTPVLEGFTFGGWYYDQALTNKVETSYKEELKYAPVEDENGCPKAVDVNIYAKWIEKEIDTSETTDGTDDTNDTESGEENPDTGADASTVLILGTSMALFVIVIYRKFSNYNKLKNL